MNVTKSETVVLVTFTEEILHRKLHFLCSMMVIQVIESGNFSKKFLFKVNGSVYIARGTYLNLADSAKNISMKNMIKRAKSIE